MKKYLVALLIGSMTFAIAQAQNTANATASSGSKFSLGPVVGAGWSTISNIKGSKFKAGINVGISTVFSAVEHFGVGLDVKYSFEGAKWKQTIVNQTTDVDWDVHYLRIPLKAIYFFNNYGDKVRPKIFAGPSFGILSSSKVNSGGTDTDLKNTTESFDFGILGGAGVNVRLAPKTWLNLDLTYTHGVKEISTDAGMIAAVGSKDLSNRNALLNVGVNFGL